MILSTLRNLRPLCMLSFPLAATLSATRTNAPYPCPQRRSPTTTTRPFCANHRSVSRRIHTSAAAAPEKQPGESPPLVTTSSVSVARSLYREVWGLNVADATALTSQATSSHVLWVVQAGAAADNSSNSATQHATAAASTMLVSRVTEDSAATPATNTNNANTTSTSSTVLSAQHGVSLPAARILATVGALDLHPSSLQQILQQLLLSRPARRAGGHAVVLSGPYLPSQLALVDKLAAGLQLSTQLLTGQLGLHVCFVAPLTPTTQPPATTATAAAAAAPGDMLWQQQETQHVQGELVSVLSPTQPITDAALSAAAANESQLIAQLRLFTPTAWSAACQVLLKRRKHTDVDRAPVLVVQRPLLGPAAMAAAETLVSKLGLKMQLLLEAVHDEQQRQGRPAVTSGAATGRRRRRRSLVTPSMQQKPRQQEGEEARGATAGDVTSSSNAVLVVSRSGVTPAADGYWLPQLDDVFLIDSSSTSTSSANGGGRSGNGDSDTPGSSTAVANSSATRPPAAGSAAAAVPLVEGVPEHVVGVHLHVLLGADPQEVASAAVGVLARAHKSGMHRSVAAVNRHSSRRSSSSSSGARPGTFKRRRAPRPAVSDVRCCTLTGPGLNPSAVGQLWQQHLEPAGLGGGTVSSSSSSSSSNPNLSRVLLWAWWYNRASTGSSNSSNSSSDSDSGSHQGSAAAATAGGSGESSSSTCADSRDSSTSSSSGGNAARQLFKAHQQQYEPCREDSSSSSSSSSNNVVGGRRRRRKPVKTRINRSSSSGSSISSSGRLGGVEEGSVAAGVSASDSGSQPTRRTVVVEFAPCTLIFSLQPLLMPQQHQQFGTLHKHARTNIPARYFS